MVGGVGHVELFPVPGLGQKADPLGPDHDLLFDNLGHLDCLALDHDRLFDDLFFLDDDCFGLAGNQSSTRGGWRTSAQKITTIQLPASHVPDDRLKVANRSRIC